MKFLGTLAFGFSTIAAMIAALLAFGFQFRVESPLSPMQMVKNQQLQQCTTALGAAEQQVAEAQAKVQGLDLRLRETILVAEQTAVQLSSEVTQRIQLASERTAAAGSSVSTITGLGLGLLMLPIGFMIGRHRRDPEAMLLTVRPQETLVVEPLRESVNALPLFDGRRAGGIRSQTGLGSQPGLAQ
ncbi:MAG: hypothetical protein WCK65_10165 [Rhodospirillaceae bacterium]